MNKLKFGKGNAKLDKRIATFSLPAGKTCPGAVDCKSMAIKLGNKVTIKDGPKTKFRCFAASQEIIYANTFESRAHNLALLKECGRSVKKMVELIDSSLPRNDYMRAHVSGDFYSQTYFDAWMAVAVANPTTLFYAYTKSLHLWTMRLGTVPSNFVLTASVGGKHDRLIHTHKLRYARVVFSEQEATDLGLAIDHDDTLAMGNGPSFALLLHGVQPKDSEAAKALSELKKLGKGGYSAKVSKKTKLPVFN